MKFLCLLYYDTAVFASLTQPELESIGPSCTPHDAALKATGRVVTQASLSTPETWFHIVPRDGQPEVKPGKYLNSSAQAGAFLVVDASNIEEAVAVASKHAAANVGERLGFAVEVRPCESFETYEVTPIGDA